jgi:hypothetical protein
LKTPHRHANGRKINEMRTTVNKADLSAGTATKKTSFLREEEWKQRREWGWRTALFCNGVRRCVEIVRERSGDGGEEAALGVGDTRAGLSRLDSERE